MTLLLLSLSALAADPAPAPVSAPAPGTAPAAGAHPPGYVPPVAHPSVDPLMPQSYRTVPRGEYPCKVRILVTDTGEVKDVEKIECGDDAYYALATAIVQWKFDPATLDGKPVSGDLLYDTTFTVETFLPRKHIVGFVGALVSIGGAGWFGAEGRVHLGEQVSFSGGVDLDQDFVPGELTPLWAPTFHADVAISSPRKHSDHRGIYGFTIGGYGDAYGSAGMYSGFRGELMTPVPGLSVGGDAGVAFLFTNPQTIGDVGIWQRDGANPFFPWLKLSLIWYAPIPRDRFVVVPREDDPAVYEPPIIEPEPLPDNGHAFDGIRSVHWSEIEPSYGEQTPVGPEFALYPPGSYRCDVRAIVTPQGTARLVRAEVCPVAARKAAEENVAHWEWPERPGDAEVQAVFPATLFVRRGDAQLVPAQSVMQLVDGVAKPLPKRNSNPPIYVHSFTPPEWGQTRPTGACYVDVDLDAEGKLLKTRWAQGEIEVSGQVMDALRSWTFYPVIITGERTAARVRLSMCDY